MPVLADGIAFNTPSDVGASGGLLQGLDPEYQAKQLALKQATAFSGGLPTTDGTRNGPIDWNAATRTLMSLGDFQGASNLMQMGVRQSALGGGFDLADPLGHGSAAVPPNGAANPTNQNAAGPMTPYRNAIGGMESDNNYGAQGPVTKSGDRAFGRYQVMGANVGPWTKEVLGQAMTPQDFLANPQAQDAVFDAKFGQSLSKFGRPQDAASVWFTGRPVAQAGNAQDQLGTTANGYVNKFMAALPRGGQPATGAASATSQGGMPAGTQVAQNGASDAPFTGPASQPSAPAAGATGTLADWAKKARPNDSTLAQRLGGALGVDPSSVVNPSDPNVWGKMLPVLRAPVPSSPDESPNPQDEKPPLNQHPFAPTPRAPAAPPAPGGQNFAPGVVAGGNPPMAQPGLQPSPTANQPSPSPLPSVGAQPAGMSPPPVAPSVGKADVNIPGLPPAYQGLEGATRYVQDLSTRAAQLDAAGLKDPAAAYEKRAQSVQNEIVAAQKYQTDLGLAQARANDRYNAQFSPEAIQGAGARAGAEASERAKQHLVPSVQPDGTTIMVPESQAIASANAGQPIVNSQPGYVTSGQGNLLTKLNDGSTALQERQVANQRLDALSGLLETFQTGANSTTFNDAVARARSLGIPIPNQATLNPAAMQEFTKNAYANVLSSMREQGNKQYAAELTSVVNSNPNPDLQPEANAAMIAQMQGIKRWNDQHYRDFATWYHANKGAPDDADFETSWVDQHPIGDYVSAAAKDIAPLGVPLPPKAQLVDGQSYRVNGSKMRWSGGSGQFVPYAGPTAVGASGSSGGQGPRTAGSQQTPSVGAVLQGFRFKGGDPSSPSSWVSVQ